MFAVEIYAAVRKFVFLEGNSRREAARVFGLTRFPKPASPFGGSPQAATRRSQPSYPWPPEQAQSGVSKPYRTTLAAVGRHLGGTRGASCANRGGRFEFRLRLHL